MGAEGLIGPASTYFVATLMILGNPDWNAMLMFPLNKHYEITMKLSIYLDE